MFEVPTISWITKPIHIARTNDHIIFFISFGLGPFAIIKQKHMKNATGNTKNMEPNKPKKKPLTMVPALPHTPYVPSISNRLIAKQIMAYTSRLVSGGVIASSLSL